jgi:Zn-finger nucleic acid-binding protein
MSQNLELFPCPSCKKTVALLTSERFGVRTFYCPDCEHVWDDPPIYGKP